MLKAQQNQLAQAANNDLVSIRTQEINYFVQFFTNFGTQCALIAGFQLSSISQVPTWDTKNSKVYVYVYWISSAICICYSIHVLLCCVYCVVFGQGLALRGPAGSMVKAVEGMMQEQRQILYNFSLNVFFLGLSTIATYFVVMDIPGAIACSIITGVGMVFWWSYCLRIYNRFKWIDNSVNWQDLGDENHAGVDDDDLLIQGVTNIKDRGKNVYSSVPKSKKKKSSIFGKMFRKSSRTSSNSDPRNEPAPSTLAAATLASIGRDKSIDHLGAWKDQLRLSRSNTDVVVPEGPVGHIFHTGYVTMPEQGVFRVNLIRYYLVLLNGLLYLYHDKNEFESGYAKAVNENRPLVVKDYDIVTVKEPNSFGIVLTPDESCTDERKTFKFFCDTYDEIKGWINAIQAEIPDDAGIDSTSTVFTPLLRVPNDTGVPSVRNSSVAGK